MTCDTTKNKRIGEDWSFFFKLKNEDGSFADLNGYTYSYIIQNSAGTTDKQGSWTINQSWQELVITISGSETSLYVKWEKKIEFKITDTNSAIFITDKAIFYAIETLHHNT